MYYVARWYDPVLGSFAQADTILPNTLTPQDWNRYSYTRYNPVRYTDPTGHCTAGGYWMPDDSPACKWTAIETAISKPSSECVGDCYDAYLTFKALAHQLGRIPTLEEILYMTAGTEYTAMIDYEGVEKFGQEAIARNYYEACYSDPVPGCQGDELYKFLSGYEPWMDKAGTANNKKTPGQRAQHLLAALAADKPWLWEDVRQILDINYADAQRWTDGMMAGEPWQWFGPFPPSTTCIENLTPALPIDTGNGTSFWMLNGEQDALFKKFCP